MHLCTHMILTYHIIVYNMTTLDILVFSVSPTIQCTSWIVVDAHNQKSSRQRVPPTEYSPDQVEQRTEKLLSME